MWRAILILCHVLVPGQLVQSPDELRTTITPQDCGLSCVRQGGPGCDYCRISSDDVNAALGLTSKNQFGTCLPWPCFKLLGEEDPGICNHYVQAPTDVTIEFVPDPEPKSDTMVVSWKPSQYGITFLRGFQVTLQPLGGFGVACQLFLFQKNLTLSVSHAQKVYKSEPFPGLSLGSDFAVTVMALPVPEKWEHFYRSKIFSTRSCAEKNGFQRCKADWYPNYIDVQQRGTVISITFNLAPPNLGITSYFSYCSANGKTTYAEMAPIAANEMDAVRKLFKFQFERRDLIEQLEEVKAQEEVLILSENQKSPRLLICYSSNDGPAHVNAVMKLAAFMQQHMATQVCLDLWDFLGLAEEGSMAWFCRQIQESDFVLVVCSWGLCCKGGTSAQGSLDSEVMVGLIGAEVGRAKSDGKDLSKYMAAIFNYSKETDIPTELGLVFRYKLPADLLLLFSQLHQVRLHTPGRYMKINNISDEDFALSPAGQALQQAISDTEEAMKENQKKILDSEEGGKEGNANA
ncbi:uncharacterized protein si:ch211-207e14.4 isoform X6 [Phyllopteryx taeniolatus]|uniref:uncharacterized protein si:ch211-207e14.4 isoform X6 n=1 Tax=Phyllopteryx taeniolatus TaxID=161469 RepID=UPI002AD227CB|nr:uncharacterized protein si:ch211-207e14.4 isoform X6 [Phyllopteryx taeniolatus]